MYKQVTKDVFEILSRHYKAEVRYFVDVTKNKRGNRTKEAIASIKTNGNGEHVSPSKVRREWKDKNKKDKLIALGRVSLGNSSPGQPVGTIVEKIRRCTAEIYNKNAFTQFRRSTLVAKLVEMVKTGDANVQTEISRMITRKQLRVVPEEATPLEVIGAKAAPAH